MLPEQTNYPGEYKLTITMTNKNDSQTSKTRKSHSLSICKCVLNPQGRVQEPSEFTGTMLSPYLAEGRRLRTLLRT